MTLALIAGRGTLPDQIAAAQAVRPLICGYEGMLPERLNVDVTYRLETLGTLLAELERRGVSQVCFCGGVDRPQLDPTKLDALTLPLVPLFQQALALGDNNALDIVKQLFEQKGFDVVGADTLLPSLLAPAGVMSARQPDAQMLADAARGAAVLDGIASLDIGQSCVIGAMQVLGVEAMGGTDHLLMTLPPNAASMAALLCKGPKRGQIREIDLPTIGPKTVEMAHQAGLAGIVIDAGDVMILEPERCIALADHHDLVLWSREREGT